MPTYEEHYHDAHDKLYDLPTQRRVADAGMGEVAGEVASETAAAPSLPEPPARNASRDTWEAYATGELGLTVTDDMGRDDIVALVDEHTKE